MDWLDRGGSTSGSLCGANAGEDGRAGQRECWKSTTIRLKWAYDRKAKPRSLNLGDQVLVLLLKP